MRCGFLFPVLLALVSPACAPARRVVVVDAGTGRPVSGARVIAAAPSYNGAEAVTDAAGAARVPVSRGDRHIIVSGAGYRSAQRDVPEKWPLTVRMEKERK